MVSRLVVRVPALSALCTVFFGLGWLLGQPAQAQQPPAPAAPAATPAPPPSTDYTNRVVAYIGNVPITREQLGEYLIERFGADKIGLLVNKLVIEKECKERGVEVNAAEIEADINQTIAQIGGLDRTKFVEQVLRARHMTLFEWREDVVRPKLMLTKLCRDQIHVEEQELRDQFEAHYGEKVQARVIIYPEKDDTILKQKYGKLRDDPNEFDHAAATQANPELARRGGEIAPIGRHTGKGDAMETLEKVAFSLRPGEISQQIQTPEGWVIMKVTGRIPADTSKKYDQERDALTQEVMERKVAELIPKKFVELHDKANVQLILQHPKSETDLKADTKAEFNPKANKGDTKNENKVENKPAPPGTTPVGN